VGLNASQYYSNISYEIALKKTISQAFINPPVSTSQIANLTVTDAIGRRRHLQANNASIFASYEIAVNSQYSLGSYSTQLESSVNSGNFTSNLQSNAAAVPGATLFVTSEATTVAVGELILCICS